MIDLRLGRWQDVLADVEACDALICDPPYSARTHEGQHTRLRDDLAYASLDEGGVRELVASWAPRVRGWLACFCDDALAPAYRAAYRDAGLYDFAPVVVRQHAPRLTGDGPGSCAVYLAVARPRSAPWSTWGALPGWYDADRVRGAGVLGAKPLDLMRAIVRDYTRAPSPGGAPPLVVDPFCGSGTTAIACRVEGRSCITAEVDPETHARAADRLARPWTPELFA